MRKFPTSAFVISVKIFNFAEQFRINLFKSDAFQFLGKVDDVAANGRKCLRWNTQGNSWNFEVVTVATKNFESSQI